MSSKTPKGNQEKTASARKYTFPIIFGVVFIVSVILLSISVGQKAHSPSDSQSVSCYTNSELQIATISADGKSVHAEVVSSQEDQAKGLSDRDCLGDGGGMLFVLDEPGNACFWMKDMNFPIDMIWLNQDKKVVFIKEDAKPESYPESFCPGQPAKYVLEVNSAVARQNNWEIGTQLSFYLPN